MNTLLLTGCTGLVGTRLLPRLVDAGFDVRALVRSDHELPAGVTAVRGDLADPASLISAVEGVDAIVHLAAFFRTTDEDAVWRANLDGTRNLLEAATSVAPNARFIMSSTGQVYDATTPRPSLESDECSPTAAYPASKVAAEGLLKASGLTWSILRLPFVYGDGDGHLEAMPALAPRFGLHPAHTYSVAHHRDIHQAITIALHGTFDGRVVNIADDTPITIFDMCEFANDPIEGSAEPLTNPFAGQMNTTLARSLGFTPTVPSIRAAAREGIL